MILLYFSEKQKNSMNVRCKFLKCFIMQKKFFFLGLIEIVCFLVFYNVNSLSKILLKYLKKFKFRTEDGNMVTEIRIYLK